MELAEPKARKKRVALTAEQTAEVIRLRRDGVAVLDLMARFNLSRGGIKGILKSAGVILSQEAKERNHAAAIARRTPETWQKIWGSSHTEDANAKRRASAQETWDADPELRALKGRQSKAWWDSQTPEQREAFFESRRGHRNGVSQAANAEYGSPGERYRAYAGSVGLAYLGAEDAVTHSKQKWRCAENHEFTAMVYSVLDGHGCPECFGKVSRAQIDLENVVRSMLPEGAAVDRGSYDVIPPFQIDVWVPSKRFAVEYNGLFWHSDGASNWRSKKEMEKALRCRAAGVDLLMVFEDEWREKRELITAMIRHRLGVPAKERFGARQLEVVHVKRAADLHSFFERNHLAGPARNASWGVALKAGDRVIAAATLRRSHVDGGLELARFAVDRDVDVPGAAGRVISAIRARVPEPLTSYSDNRLSQGRVYEQLGFIDVTEPGARPSYYYTDSRVRVWRFQCRRDNDPAVLAEFPTEEAQARGGHFSQRLFGDRRPLYRIEDAGHRKWRLG